MYSLEFLSKKMSECAFDDPGVAELVGATERQVGSDTSNCVDSSATSPPSLCFLSESLIIPSVCNFHGVKLWARNL